MFSEIIIGIVIHFGDLYFVTMKNYSYYLCKPVYKNQHKFIVMVHLELRDQVNKLLFWVICCLYQ